MVSFNGADGQNCYHELGLSADALIARLEAMLTAANLPTRLRDLDVPEASLPDLAEEAAKQWTAQFNPKPVDAKALLQIYRQAY